MISRQFFSLLFFSLNFLLSYTPSDPLSLSLSLRSYSLLNFKTRRSKLRALSLFFAVSLSILRVCVFLNVFFSSTPHSLLPLRSLPRLSKSLFFSLQWSSDTLCSPSTLKSPLPAKKLVSLGREAGLLTAAPSAPSLVGPCAFKKAFREEA